MRLRDACRIEVHGRRVMLAGDLDLLRAKDFRKALACASGDEVDLDVSGVVFLGWPGLKVLLDARLNHSSLRITAANPRVLAILEASGTAEYLTAIGGRRTNHPSRWRDGPGESWP